MSHSHKHCAHTHLAYCTTCQVVYCHDCGQEWVARQAGWTWTGDIGYRSMTATNAECPVQAPPTHRHGS